MPGPLDPRSPDWAAEATDRVVNVVDTIRDKTTVPLTTVARGVVYGLVAAVMGVAVVVLLAVTGVRVVDVLVPGEVWSAHLILGMIFCFCGLWLWSKRRRKE